jgi:predicted transcriptional regulator
MEESEIHRQMLSRKPNPYGDHVYYLTPRQFPSVFSEKRLELAEYVKKNPHATVTQLAKMLKRKQEAISRDLSVLKDLGLITKTSPKTKKRTTSTPAFGSTPTPALSFSIR